VSARKRPDPLRWLWYAVGGRLPARYNDWVLHDTTSSTWILRHIARSLVMLALPIAALVIFLPTSTGLKVLTAFTAGGCGMMFMLVHIIETTERRLIRAGYPAGSAEATRHQRSIDSQVAGNAARRARNQARIDKRRR
jgi:Family of unknown function (DUF5313)